MAIVVLVFFLLVVLIGALYLLPSALRKADHPLARVIVKIIGFDEEDPRDRQAQMKQLRSYLIVLAGILVLFSLLLYMKGHELRTPFSPQPSTACIFPVPPAVEPFC